MENQFKSVNGKLAAHTLPTLPDYRADKRWHINYQNEAGDIIPASFRDKIEAIRYYNALISSLSEKERKHLIIN